MAVDPDDDTNENAIEDMDLDGPFRCWCGAEGTFEEMFDFGDAESGCGGSGTITCECGGDFCVCHHHGEYECPGCDDCRDHDFDDCWPDYDDED